MNDSLSVIKRQLSDLSKRQLNELPNELTNMVESLGRVRSDHPALPALKRARTQIRGVLNVLDTAREVLPANDLPQWVATTFHGCRALFADIPKTAPSKAERDLDMARSVLERFCNNVAEDDEYWSKARDALGLANAALDAFGAANAARFEAHNKLG